jgi:hypothetical protein
MPWKYILLADTNIVCQGADCLEFREEYKKKPYGQIIR